MSQDFLAGGELYFHVNHFGRLGEYRACFYAAEILLAMQFIHESGIVYRDVEEVISKTQPFK